MAFTKKVWVSGGNIPYTDLNRLEVGVNDIYNIAVTLNGHKTFGSNLSHIAASSYKISFKAAAASRSYIHSPSSTAIQFDQEASYTNPFRFESPIGTLANLELKDINSIAIESHAARHKNGGADTLIRTPNIVVALSGQGGDYTSLSAAIAASVIGDVIYVREGVYYESGIITPKNNTTIIGSGWRTIIELNSTSARFNMTGSGVVMRNFTIRNTVYTDANYLVEISGSYVVLDDIYVISRLHGIRTTGTKIWIKNCLVENTMGSTDVRGIMLSGYGCFVTACRTFNFFLGISMTTSRHIVSNNDIQGYGGGAGLQLFSTANYCVMSNNRVRSHFTSLILDSGVTRCISNGLAYTLSAAPINSGTNCSVTQSMAY
jgi:hypothetical protein